MDLLDAFELGDVLANLIGDLGADRAAWRGEREGHVDLGLLDLVLVDQAEVDEVQPELWVDHVVEGFLDVVDRHGWHAAQVSSLGWAYGRAAAAVHRHPDRGALCDPEGWRPDRDPAHDRPADRGFAVRGVAHALPGAGGLAAVPGHDAGGA